MRAVLDPNVVISGLLSPSGSPAAILRAFEQGSFELVASPLLLAELERALAYPKLRSHIAEDDAADAVRWLSESATNVPDPTSHPPARSKDSGDDYLIALAAAERALLVSGDRHLLDLADEIPVLAPRQFLELLNKHEWNS